MNAKDVIEGNWPRIRVLRGRTLDLLGKLYNVEREPARVWFFGWRLPWKQLDSTYRARIADALWLKIHDPSIVVTTRRV